TPFIPAWIWSTEMVWISVEVSAAVTHTGNKQQRAARAKHIFLISSPNTLRRPTARLYSASVCQILGGESQKMSTSTKQRSSASILARVFPEATHVLQAVGNVFRPGP